MNREEAQFILGAYRPNSADAHDPLFREALDLAQRDPVLSRWFAEQQALDLAFSAKIRGRPIPADLRSQLLLARTTARRGGVGWPRPLWLAAAACFVIGLLLASRWLRPARPVADFAAFRTAMAEVASDMSAHADVWGLDAAGYRQWLTEHQGAADFVLPATLAEKGIAACKIVGWQDRKVTMLCLKFGGQHLDVFVVDAADLPGVALGAAPRFFADAGHASAAWQRDGKIYLVAGTLPKAELQQLL